MNEKFRQDILNHELQFVEGRIKELREKINDKKADDFEYGLFTAYSNAVAALYRIKRVF